MFRIDQYWRNVMSVLSGSVMAQAIPILGSLVIARQYAPASFGVFSAWLGGVTIISVIVTARLEKALVNEADGKPRYWAMHFVVVTSLLGTLLSAIALLIALQIIPEKIMGVGGLLVGIAIPSAFLVAMTHTWQSWAAADGKYRSLSIMRIAQAASVTVLQIGVGFYFPTAEMLALGYMAGVFAGLVVSIILMPLHGLSMRRLKAGTMAFWKRHSGFPIYSLPADTINTAAGQLPILIVATRFGAESAGLLALTMRVLGAPIGLLGNAVLDVFKRQAAASYRENGECRNEYIRTFRILTLGAVIFAIVTAFFGELIFEIAFGSEWIKSGTIAIWFLPMFAFRFVSSPLSYMVYIANKQHYDLVWQIGLLVITVGTLIFLTKFDETMQAYSIGYSFMYVVYLVMTYRFSLGTRMGTKK